LSWSENHNLDESDKEIKNLFSKVSKNLMKVIEFTDETEPFSRILDERQLFGPILTRAPYSTQSYISSIKINDPVPGPHQNKPKLMKSNPNDSKFDN
jgi:hypothetical protein